MADEIHNTGIHFENIDPWLDGHGDTGLSTRQKLKRNFDKIKAWMDGIGGLPSLLGRFLSKVDDDEAQGEITFRKGAKFGRFRSRFLGSGVAIDAAGNAEFESIYSRSFISTPEFRFNRVFVTDGEQWCTNGYGTIESVLEGVDESDNPVVNGGLITLHLEENDYASVAVGDICRGIYNDIASQYQTADLDDDVETAAGTSAQEGDGMGFSTKRGFFTSYFYIERIVKSLKGECQFIYKLRSATTPHPCTFMKFAQYGSFTDATRRASRYESSIGHYHEMVLEGVKTWQIESANVVYRKGYLGDIEVELADGSWRKLSGYGLYVQNNVYFGSAVVQLDPKTLEQLENDLAQYDVNISGYASSVQVDNHGYIVGGICTEETSGDTVTRTYRIHSAITVRKNGRLLTEALPTAEAGAGTYKIIAAAVDCQHLIDDSTLYITHIDNLLNMPTDDPSDYDPSRGKAMERCRVDLVIDCEGRQSIQKSIVVAINHDGQDGKGVEYIFLTVDNWDGQESTKPTIYDDPEERQQDDYCPYTDQQHTDQWTDEPTGVSDNLRVEFYAQRKQVNGIWQPFGDVKLWNRYVVDGVTPYMIDLSNEQSFVACDGSGDVISGASYEPSRLLLMFGQRYAFTDFAITVTPTGIRCNGNSSAFTLTAEQKAAAQIAGYFELTPSNITARSATIAVQAVYGNITLSAVYKVNKSYAGKDGQNSIIYSLMPSLDTIRKNKNGSLVDTTLTLQVKKTVGASATILTSYSQLQDEGLSLQYQNASGTSSLSDISIATSTLIGSGLWGKVNLIKSNVIIDSERLNVVTDGSDGAPGPKGAGIVLTLYRNNLYTDSDWGTYCAIGHTEPWSKRDWDADFTTCRIGDYFVVTGTASDTGRKHNATFQCTAVSTNQITGISVAYTNDGGAGPMYYPAGIHDPDKTYSVTSQLVPVVCSNGSNNPQYYYAKKSVPADQDIPVTNSEYWAAFSNFAAAFIEVLFANFAKLGGFIIYGNLFFSQKGTINGEEKTDYKDPNFQPYLKMDAANGQIYARRGTIGGFEIGDDYLGAYSSFTDSVSIHKDGYVELRNSSRNYALQVLGGVNIDSGSKSVNIDANTGGYVQIGGPNVNINTDRTMVSNGNTTIGNDTNEFFVNAQKSTFSNQAAFNSGVDVSGVFSSPDSIVVDPSSFSLPASPKKGQMFFCKGINRDFVVTIPSGQRIYSQTGSGYDEGSLSLGKLATILVCYDATNKYWIRFYCG